MFVLTAFEKSPVQAIQAIRHNADHIVGMLIAGISALKGRLFFMPFLEGLGRGPQLADTVENSASSMLGTRDSTL
jgi:hypothetical protein